MAKNAVAKTWRVPIVGSFWRSFEPADSLAPTVPVLQSVIPVSSSSIQVTFARSEDAQSGVKEYICKFRISGSGAAYAEHSRVPKEISNPATYTQTMGGLTASTTYETVVAAVDNENNVSADSTSATATTQAGATGTFDPLEPAFAMYAIGNSQNYTVSIAPSYGRYPVVIMSGGFPSYGTSRSTPRETFVQAVHSASIHSSGTLVFQYMNFGEMKPARADASHPLYWDEVTARNWWLLDSWPSGSQTISNFSNLYRLINYTDFSSVNPSGQHVYEWTGTYFCQMFRDGTLAPTNNAAPSLDGVFLDNCLINPQVNAGDWDKDGTSDPASEVQVNTWLQAGQKRFFDTVKANSPAGKYLAGNIGDYGRYSTNQGPMKNVLHCGLFESVLGMSYSPEGNSSAAEIMRRYRADIDFLQSPKICIFGIRTPSLTDWEWIRYGVCMALIEKGFPCVQMNQDLTIDGVKVVSYTSDPATWIEPDEMFGGTLNTPGYLGRRVDARQLGPIANVEAGGTGGGTWRMRFTNGEVWVNMRRGSGTKTAFDQTTPYPAVPIGRTVRAINGTKDTTVNNGATGITMFPSLPPCRGRIYLY